MTAQPRVLRNVTVSDRPHALVRPEGAPVPAGPVVSPPVPAMAVPPQPEAPAVDLQTELQLAFERGSERGREEGRSEAFDAACTEALDQARAQGFNEGREAGLKAAHEEARAAVQPVLAVLERLLAELPQKFDMRLAAYEDDMVALCFEAVARMLGREGASQDGIRAMLKTTLAAFGPRQLVDIRVHPGDVQCLAGDAAVAAWLRERESGQGIQILADPSVELGGVVLRSPAGRLDARLEHQVDALRAALLSARMARATARSAPSAGGAAGTSA
jgi:flagellar assembly protein FliH